LINRVIKLLISSDVTLFFAIGLLAPIFAIFVLQEIQGGTLKVIGLAASMYWIARTLTTVPLSKFMDKTEGERDEYHFMLVGSYIMASIPLFYMFTSQPWHIYLLGFINGSAASMAVPGWRILFTNHLDKGRTGYEWSIEDVGVGFAIAISSYLGAFLTDIFGFKILFILIAVIGVTGVTLFVVPLRKYTATFKEMRRKHRIEKKHAPRKIDTIK